MIQRRRKKWDKRNFWTVLFVWEKKNNETSLQNPKLSYDDMNEGAESEALQFYLANQLDPLAYYDIVIINLIEQYDEFNGGFKSRSCKWKGH